MIFQPTTNAKEGEVMPLLHAQAKFAKEPDRTVYFVGLAQLPAEFEQVIHFVAGYRSGLTN